MIREARCISPTDSLTAELLAILNGLQLAWKKRYSQVILESDSVDGRGDVQRSIRL